VRRLCNNCRKETVLQGDDKATVESILATVNDKTYLEGLDASHAFMAVGCDECNMTGYKSRIGIHEGIKMDEREIAKAAEPQNLLTLAQDGIIKVLQGITTLEELRRIVDIEK
jgi:type II secretory ATPase GspE/PulE/Tfp pilus assembly ATPase PilB-like protein